MRYKLKKPMPKGTRRTSAQDSARDTSTEITVRSYDRRMRRRFEEAQKAITILIDVSAGNRASDEDAETRARNIINACFGSNIFNHLHTCACEAKAMMQNLIDQYDLMTVSYLMDDTCANRKQYFALMSCENLDSFLWGICARMHEHIEQIREVAATIEEIQNPARAELTNRARGKKVSPSSIPAEHGTFAKPRVSRMSASARRAAKASSRMTTSVAVLWPLLEAERSMPRDVASAFMSAQWIRCVIERAGVAPNAPATAVATAAATSGAASGATGVDIFAALRNTLRIADDGIVRTMDWAHPICNPGQRDSDALCCEDCGARMRVLQDMSEAVCDKCGKIVMIIGSAIASSDESSASATSASSCAGAIDTGRNSRRGGYNYVRHLKIWLDRLQAIESNEFDQDDIARLRGSIASEYISPGLINWRALSCDDIVRHLSLCGLSRLGEHVPKILKELGGRAPPILDYDSEQVIMRDFMHIMDIYSHLYNEPGNKPYYPFFIAKIIKRRFKTNSEIFRMLQYVSKQGHDTVNKNDRIYKRICECAPPQYDLIYEPETE